MGDTMSEQKADRIVTLDTVRGVAVMGILAMNILAFAWPFPVYLNPAAGAGDSGIDLTSWLVSFLVFDGKMRGLFSILFGASTLLVIQRATEGGRGGARAHYARMTVLLLFGLAHFYLLWFGDILVGYAIAGMVLYWMRNLSVTKLVALGLSLVLVSMLMMTFMGGGALIASNPAAPPESATELAGVRSEVEKMTGAQSPMIGSELALYRSDYETIFHHRFVEKRWDPLVGATFFLFETLGLMLFGMALFKSGFLTGEWSRKRYLRWGLVSAILALPPLAALAWWQVDSSFDAAVVFLSSMALSIPFDMLMAVAWAALVILWVQDGAMTGLHARVAAAGRMAFTNYLTTSLVMTTIFYGYGFALFGEVGRAALWIPVIGMWAAMLSWSKPWLDRFHYGPLEWLWRSMSRGSVQPMRR
jgi:uncharacterized protein